MCIYIYIIYIHIHYIYTYIYIYIHIYIHTYIYIYTHIYIYTTHSSRSLEILANSALYSALYFSPVYLVFSITFLLVFCFVLYLFSLMLWFLKCPHCRTNKGISYHINNVFLAIYVYMGHPFLTCMMRDVLVATLGSLDCSWRWE